MSKNKNFFQLIEDEKTKNIIYGELKELSQVNNFSDSDFLKVSNKIITFEYFYEMQNLKYNNCADPKQINPKLMDETIEEWKKEIVTMTQKNCKFEISTLKISKDLAFVFLPGEIFTETSIQIKEKSPFRFTMVIGYSNGSVGYIPPKSAYKYGGYEVEDAYKFYHHPAPFAPETTDVLVRNCIEELNLLACEN